MKKILIAEDDRQTREIMDMVLKKKGFETSLAKTGMEAVSIFEKEHVDLVILDIIMPELDGISTAQILRKMNPEIPLIAVTACEKSEPKLFENDVFYNLSMSYIRKPFELKQLVDTVRTKLNH